MIKVSPLLMLNLTNSIASTVRSIHSQYFSPEEQVERYIRRWLIHDFHGFNEPNFTIYSDRRSGFDLEKTLDSMQDELIFQIAVDLGIEVPGLIYSVAVIKDLLTTRNEDAGKVFDKALKDLYSNPDTAIIMASSALEKIIKEISKEIGIEEYREKHTLYQQVGTLLKGLSLYPSDKSLDHNLKTIGSGLLTVGKAVEEIRSRNTNAHATDESVIQDPLYAMFIINTSATVGLFLLNYYKKVYPTLEPSATMEDEVPF